jgi:ABC-type transport system substrate-binding protein
MDHQPVWDDLPMLTEEWYGRNLWQYDPEKAKELWDATGYGEISESLEYYAYTPNLTNYLGQVASDLKKNLGMDIKLNSLDYSSFNGPLPSLSLGGRSIRDGTTMARSTEKT